ncbi:Hypothetical predicted protein, partial [Paramuricea clavata]
KKEKIDFITTHIASVLLNDPNAASASLEEDSESDDSTMESSDTDKDIVIADTLAPNSDADTSTSESDYDSINSEPDVESMFTTTTRSGRIATNWRVRDFVSRIV